eukprot:scaffold1453_cov112-Isochrysis_galbana.AAC.13
MEHGFAQQHDELVAQIGPLALQRQERAEHGRRDGGRQVEHILEQLLQPLRVLEHESGLLADEILQQRHPVLHRVAAGDHAGTERLHHLCANHRVHDEGFKQHRLAQKGQARCRGQPVVQRVFISRGPVWRGDEQRRGRRGRSHIQQRRGERHERRDEVVPPAGRRGVHGAQQQVFRKLRRLHRPRELRQPGGRRAPEGRSNKGAPRLGPRQPRGMGRRRAPRRHRRHSPGAELHRVPDEADHAGHRRLLEAPDAGEGEEERQGEAAELHRRAERLILLDGQLDVKDHRALDVPELLAVQPLRHKLGGVRRLLALLEQ